MPKITGKLIFWAIVILTVLALARCQRIRPVFRRPDAVLDVKTTGYCACGTCCGWKFNWFGLPVHTSGPNKNRFKRIGQTASGRMARPGTVAADLSVFPMGTRVYVPGYGWGRVEDIGGAVKGHHLDLFFLRHGTAKKWGVQTRRVRIWYPRPDRQGKASR